MEEVLPATMNYLDVLPKAIPSEKTRKRFFSSNGRTFGPSQTIKIDLESSRSFLDPSNCFLDFEFVNTTGQTCCFDLGGGFNFIKNFRIHQGGNEILRMNNVNKLMNSVIIPSSDSMAKRSNSTLQGQTRYGNDAGLGNLNLPEVAANTDGDLITGSQFGTDADYDITPTEPCRFSVPLIGGLFSQTGISKLLPLPLLNQPIELYFDLANLNEPCCWNNPAPPTAWTLQDVSVIADLVEVPRDVIGFMKELQLEHGGSLAIQSQGYEHNSGVLTPNAGAQTINIPSRKRSIKSIFFCCASNDYGAAGVAPEAETFNLSFSGNPCIGSFFIRAGGLVMPQPAVVCSGNPNVAGRSEYFKGEQYLELKKAMGHLGHGVGTGILSTISYGNTDGDNSDGAGGQQSGTSNQGYVCCPFGFSLDAYQNEAIKAGLDTQTLSLEMQLNLEITANGGVIQAENQVVDVWSLYDIQYYFNSDGTITFED